MVLTRQADELGTKGDSLLRQADKLLCESWNERMWADSVPIDPSPSVDQALNRDTLGWRMSARGARRAAMPISRHSPTRRRPLFTILPADSAAASAPKAGAVPATPGN